MCIYDIYCGAAFEKLPFYQHVLYLHAWCLFGWPMPELCEAYFPSRTRDTKVAPSFGITPA